MNTEKIYRFPDAVRLVNSVAAGMFGDRLFDFSTAQDCNYTKFDSFAVSEEILQRIYSLKKTLLRDAKNIFLRDPAAGSISEVVYSYPGFFAIFCHRIAHIVYEYEIELLPRLISEYAHSLTGIDIHPGAKICEGLAIDHGTGIVIGETAEIGEDVTIYHGVTLGSKSVVASGKDRPQKGQKRHPTIERGCILCAGAMIFGKDTVIGENSVIGAGARITSSVLPNSVIRCNSN